MGKQARDRGARTPDTVEAQVARVQQVLGTLIVWMPQSANSPIRKDEAEHLLKMLEPE